VHQNCKFGEIPQAVYKIITFVNFMDARTDGRSENIMPPKSA